MSDNPAQKAIHDLLDHVESLEIQTRAILGFMKENGMLTDETLAPYMKQAAVASDVRARAARARIDHLFDSDDKAKPAITAVSVSEQEAYGISQQSVTQKGEGRVDSQPTEPAKSMAEKSLNASAHEDEHLPSEIVSANKVFQGEDGKPENRIDTPDRPGKKAA